MSHAFVPRSGWTTMMMRWTSYRMNPQYRHCPQQTHITHTQTLQRLKPTERPTRCSPRLSTGQSFVWTAIEREKKNNKTKPNPQASAHTKHDVKKTRPSGSAMVGRMVLRSAVCCRAFQSGGDKKRWAEFRSSQPSLSRFFPSLLYSFFSVFYRYVYIYILRWFFFLIRPRIQRSKSTRFPPKPVGGKEHTPFVRSRSTAIFQLYSLKKKTVPQV